MKRERTREFVKRTLCDWKKEDRRGCFMRFDYPGVYPLDHARACHPTVLVRISQSDGVSHVEMCVPMEGEGEPRRTEKEDEKESDERAGNWSP